jgi:hypothetical protein
MKKVLHKNSEKETLEGAVLNNLEELKQKLINTKNIIYSYLQDPENNLSNLKTQRNDITMLLGLTILNENNRGKVTHSNLEQIHKEKVFRVYQNNSKIHPVIEVMKNPNTLGLYTFFDSRYKSSMLCPVIDCKTQIEAPLSEMTDKVFVETVKKFHLKIQQKPNLIPLSLMFKARLKNEKSLYTSDRSFIIRSKTLRYLNSFYLYNNEVLFNIKNKNYIRQEVIRIIRNKRAAHGEEGKFEFNNLEEEIMFTMTIFQITWDVVYNFLKVDCFLNEG